MRKMVSHSDAYIPKSIEVSLNENLTINVICFDFKNQLLGLIQNESLMTQDNLLIDIDKPTRRYKSPNNILSEALSGSAYQKIYNKAHANHDGHLLLLVIPICL